MSQDGGEIGDKVNTSCSCAQSCKSYTRVGTLLRTGPDTIYSNKELKCDGITVL